MGLLLIFLQPVLYAAVRKIFLKDCSHYATHLAPSIQSASIIECLLCGCYWIRTFEGEERVNEETADRDPMGLTCSGNNRKWKAYLELSDKWRNQGAHGKSEQWGCPNEPWSSTLRLTLGGGRAWAGPFDEEVWDRKRQNSWQGEFEGKSDAARTIIAAFLSS